MKKILLSFVLLGIVLLLPGCKSAVSDTTIDGTDSLVTGAISSNSGAIGQIDSSTGTIGTADVFSHFEKGKFFMIARNTSRQSEFDVFDKNNVERPLYTITLPQTATGKYMTWAPEKPLFFDNADMYMVAFFQANDGLDPWNQNPDYILFKVSFTGSLLAIANLGKSVPLGAGMEPVIDNVGKKVIRSSYSQGRLIVFDMATKALSYRTYTNTKGLIIKGLRSYEDNIAIVEVDKPGQDGWGPSTKFVAMDISTSNPLQEWSLDEYQKLFLSPKQIIQYSDCDMGGTCMSFTVRGRPYTYTGGVYFTDVMNNDTMLFGRYDGNKGEGNRRLMNGFPMYAFVPLAGLK